MRKTIADIVSFADATTAPEIDHPRPERLVQGNPQRKTWNHYTDRNEQFFSGVWECEPGAWKVYYDANEDEFCYIVQGRFRLHDNRGGYRDSRPATPSSSPAASRACGRPWRRCASCT